MDAGTPSARVIEAVAQKEGVSAIELVPPLYDAVDPDALDALVQSDADPNASRVEIEFTYRNYLVRVRNTPEVTVSIREEVSSTAPSPSVGED